MPHNQFRLRGNGVASKVQTHQLIVFRHALGLAISPGDISPARLWLAGYCPGWRLLVQLHFDLSAMSSKHSPVSKVVATSEHKTKREANTARRQLMVIG